MNAPVRLSKIRLPIISVLSVIIFISATYKFTAMYQAFALGGKSSDILLFIYSYFIILRTFFFDSYNFFLLGGIFYVMALPAEHPFSSGLRHYLKYLPMLSFTRIREWCLALPAFVFIGILTLVFFALTAYLSGDLFGHIPHIADSHAQYAQANILVKEGRFYALSHEFPRFFDIQFFVNDGKFYSQFPPGHIIMLALGHLVNVPWLINPLLGSATIIAIYFLGKEVGGEATGRISAVLMLMSPFVVFMSSEFMNHATALLMLTLFFFFFLRGMRQQNALCFLTAGFVAGYAFITRPHAAFMMLLPVAIFLLLKCVKRSQGSWKSVFLLALGFAPCCILLLYFNWQTTGNPFQMGYQKAQPRLYDYQNIIHFWINFQDFVRMSYRVYNLNISLFCWPISCFIFVFLLFVFNAKGKYGNLLIASCLSLAFGLMLITSYVDPIFEPRYLYETSTILIVLTALCLKRLPAICRRRLKLRFQRSSFYNILCLIVIALHLSAYPLIGNLYRLYSNDYWEGSAPYVEALNKIVEKPALIFFQDYVHFRYMFYTFPPREDSEIIYARDLGKKVNKELIDFYPKRHVYAVNGNVIKKVNK
jgi:4-amino-4-deoxy-L-arabinose transferase-like glycosyltransferase